MSKYVYTADAEDPDCGRCDHVCDSYEFCNENCGPEHFWNGYCRTEFKETEMSPNAAK